MNNPNITISKKLHLGCGEKYMEGYCNIDYPPSEHTVQTATRPDMYADIKTLAFTENSIEEIRLHHVFEHFDRIDALRLLIQWHGWLQEGGQLIIETPDFKKCAKVALLSPSIKKQYIALRHIFGSHEAQWAVHWDGWYKEKYKMYLNALGYSDLRFEYSSWSGTYNITVYAKKKSGITFKKQLESAKELLSLSCLPGEDRMLQQWIKMLNHSFGIE